MILARAWGCTPAQLRDHTLAELEEMTQLLIEQHEARERSSRG